MLDFGPRTIAGHANEKLIAVVSEAIAQCDAEKLRRRIRVAIVDRMSVVEVPEPNVLGRVA